MENTPETTQKPDSLYAVALHDSDSVLVEAPQEFQEAINEVVAERQKEKKINV